MSEPAPGLGAPEQVDGAEHDIHQRRRGRGLGIPLGWVMAGLLVVLGVVIVAPRVLAGPNVAGIGCVPRTGTVPPLHQYLAIEDAGQPVLVPGGASVTIRGARWPPVCTGCTPMRLMASSISRLRSGAPLPWGNSSPSGGSR